MTAQQLAAIFNEWARQYAADPESFGGEIIDANGQPVTDYGDRCASFFLQIAAELNAEPAQGRAKR